LSYLLDTNVISELRKRDRGHPSVIRWAASVDPVSLFTSVLVIGEIRRGIELKRRTDTAQAIALEVWFDRMRLSLGGRIIAVDERIADAWGRLGVPDAVPAVDGLLAATALVHDLTVVSRNVSDLRRTTARVLNPFSRP
jgi:predicted nucleic acid-binding protein